MREYNSAVIENNEITLMPRYKMSYILKSSDLFVWTPRPTAKWIQMWMLISRSSMQACMLAQALAFWMNEAHQKGMMIVDMMISWIEHMITKMDNIYSLEW